jgi:hypothetical protein
MYCISGSPHGKRTLSILVTAVLVGCGSSRTAALPGAGKRKIREPYVQMSDEQRSLALTFLTCNSVGVARFRGITKYSELRFAWACSLLTDGYRLEGIEESLSVCMQDAPPVWRNMLQGILAIWKMDLTAAKAHFMSADRLAPDDCRWPRFCALVLSKDMRDPAALVALAGRLVAPASNEEGGILECIKFVELCMDRMLRSEEWNTENTYLRLLIAQQLSSRLSKNHTRTLLISPATSYAYHVAKLGKEVVGQHLKCARLGAETFKELSAAHWLNASLVFVLTKGRREVTLDIAASAQTALDLGYKAVDMSDNYLLIQKAVLEKDDSNTFRQAVLLGMATEDQVDTRHMYNVASEAASRITDSEAIEELDDEIMARAIKLWPESESIRQLIVRRDAQKLR